MKKYQVNYNLLPDNKKLALGTILMRSGLFKKEERMRAYLDAGKVKVAGKEYQRAGQPVKINRNNIKIDVKDKGKIIIKLEDGDKIEE
mgnify:CR=1 FL=1